MSTILYSIEPIAYSDNFKVWIDRFNDIVTELKTTNFAVNDEYVDRQNDQTIIGVKTFDNASIFNSNVTISGNLNLANGLIQTNNAAKQFNSTYAVDGNINFIGANGINLLANASDYGFSFSFPTASTFNTLILDYETAGGIFKIANNVNLEIQNSKIKFGANTWTFPSFPGVESVLTYDTGTSAIVWKSATSLVEDLTSEIASSVALINTNEMMPVGTIIEVDTTKAQQWSGSLAGGNIPDEDFYGWLILNGGTITATDANSVFVELVDLLVPGQTGFPRSATLLPNSTTGSPATVKLIKYLPDAVSSFSLAKGNGISFFEANGTTPKNTASLKNGITHIALNADSTVFQFTGGQLQLKTNIPRYNSGRLTTATPAANTDAVNKEYVDTRILSGGVEGSCFDLMESSDGLGYSDAKNSFSIVDKSGAGRAWRTVATSTLSSGSIDADVTLNSIGPFGSNLGKVTQLQRTFATPDQFFFVDQDDVVYGYGTNARGDIAATSRGISEFSSYYDGFFPTNPYNSSVQISQLLPAFLPIKEKWSANAVLLDSVTGISGSNDSYSNITLKTKDGYDNSYNNVNSATSGLVSYFNGTIPYTRGYYLSTGLNNTGQFGRGDLVSTSAATGPLVWGPTVDSPGRNLWYNFALTETQKQTIKTPGELTTLLNSSSSEQIRKRFNWFKPNAITAGGLATSAPDALSAWRTQTGLTTEAFNDYSWYIKKVVRTYDAHYVIVGKPGNESDNEVWCTGVNRKGAFGNLRANSLSLSDFAPMLTAESDAVINPQPSNIAGTFRVLGTTTPTATGTVFERSNLAAHNLLDFDTLTYGTTNYYVILGNAAGANRATQFRLFSSFNGARLAFIGSSQTTDDVLLSNSATNGIAAANLRRSRLRGIVDISVSRGTGADTSGDGIILRKALTFDTLPAGLLDSVPEQNILTDRLYCCGLNSNGRLAVGQDNLTNPNLPTITAFSGSAPGTNNKIVKIQTCNFSAVSFALASNGVLYFAGNRASGCANSGSAATGNISIWTSFNLPNVHDFFVIDDASRTRIFVIVETAPSSGIFELYVGGININYILGTSVSLGVATPKYAKVIFPENAKNIVNIAGAMDQTYILCKDEGEDIGRVYVAGKEVSRSYFPVSTQLKTIPQFKKIDRDIL
jgi:hypothetical protein